MEPDLRDPMNQYSLQSLRESCDEYYDGRDCPSPGWVTMTEFSADQTKDLWNAAKLALNIYNQKEQKNFNLEKVCKLNFIVSYFFMTFTAKNAETDECRVFRGVVHALSDTVYLCEAKQKNSNLEKVCKLNFIISYFFMTFTAKNAETYECRVFRGDVHALSDTVYLCEVKETDDIGIPSDGVENHSPRTWDPTTLLYIY